MDEAPRYAVARVLTENERAKLALIGMGLMVRAIDGERGMDKLPILLDKRADNHG